MNKKVLYIIPAVIIIIGIIIFAIKGLNNGFEYGEYTRINVYMTEANALDDVKNIIKESFDGKFTASYTDEFKDTITLKLKGINEEQLNTLSEKLNEKYKFDDKDDNIRIIKTARIELFDIIRDYIVPIIISLVVILVYFAIAYRKNGVLKSVVEPLIQIVLINGLYFSILAIFRLPINEYTIPFGTFVYIMSILGTIININNIKMEAE